MIAHLGLATPKKGDGKAHVYHLYVIEVENRQKVQAGLKSAGVQTGIHYPIPIHLQAAYSDLKLGPGAFPRTEAAAHRLLSLPMFPEIKEIQIDRVVGALKQSLGRT